MVRIERIYVVDGVQTGISCEGGSAKEALAYVIDCAEGLGAAPMAASMVPTAPGGKRGRASKNDLAKTVPGEAVPAHQMNPPPASAPPMPAQFMPPPSSMPTTFAPGAPLPPSTVTMTAPQMSGPIPAPPGMAPPAPPPMFPPPSHEQVVKSELTAAVNHLYGSVPQDWAQHTQDAVRTMFNGVGMDQMTEPQAVQALANVRAYQQKVELYPSAERMTDPRDTFDAEQQAPMIKAHRAVGECLQGLTVLQSLAVLSMCVAQIMHVKFTCSERPRELRRHDNAVRQSCRALEAEAQRRGGANV